MNKSKLIKIGVIFVVLLLISGIYFYKNVWNRPAEPSAAVQSNQKLPKLVDLGSDTCVPCKMMAPILAELQKEYEGKVVIEIIDVYKEQDKLKEYSGIRAIPTQILFDADGVEVGRHEGFISKEDLVKAFEMVGVK